MSCTNVYNGVNNVYNININVNIREKYLQGCDKVKYNYPQSIKQNTTKKGVCCIVDTEKMSFFHNKTLESSEKTPTVVLCTNICSELNNYKNYIKRIGKKYYHIDLSSYIYDVDDINKWMKCGDKINKGILLLLCNETQMTKFNHDNKLKTYNVIVLDHDHKLKYIKNFNFKEVVYYK
jgi:hypothetical protein